MVPRVRKPEKQYQVLSVVCTYFCLCGIFHKIDGLLCTRQILSRMNLDLANELFLKLNILGVLSHR